MVVVFLLRDNKDFVCSLQTKKQFNYYLHLTLENSFINYHQILTVIKLLY